MGFMVCLFFLTTPSVLAQMTQHATLKGVWQGPSIMTLF